VAFGYDGKTSLQLDADPLHDCSRTHVSICGGWHTLCSSLRSTASTTTAAIKERLSRHGNVTEFVALPIH
jgi:hypothetical protein